MQRIKPILITTVTALWLALFVGLPIAAQADGGDTTLIHACVAKDGTMRIVSTSTTCKNNETALHFPSVGRVTTIESKNASQDTAITGVQNKNTSQDTAISNLQAKDNSQDAAIAAAGGGGVGVYVDTNGTVVGPLIDFGRTARSIPQFGTNKPYQILLSVDAIGDSFGTVVKYYTSTDCSGTAQDGFFYSLDEPTSFANFLYVFNGQIRHSTGTKEQITVGSYKYFNADGTPQSLSCDGAGTTPFPADVGNVEILDVYNTLGVQPPFHIQ